MKELRDLLSGFAQAAPNTGPAPGIEIYKGIRYLMPLKDAVKALGIGQEVNSKLMVACPGFPFNALFGFSFHGSFEDGFDTVYFVTDGARQVVAVEFTNVSTKKIKLDTPLTNKAWVTFDFVNTRVKGQPDAFSEKTGKPDIRGAYGLHGREMIAWLVHLQHTRAKNI
ncbi:MAG: hypothetical protein WCK17_07025, partial [Verrucomicrobiota bacterium]